MRTSFFRYATLAIAASISLSVHCQFDEAYFNSLNSEKAGSDSLISWHQFGPGNSGYCEIVKYHPTDPNCIMMSPDMFNTYGSWDNGNTWQTVKDADGNGRDMRRMRDYSFSMQDPDFGVALDNTGLLWITHDRGRSWKSSASFDKGTCSVVEIDPVDDQVIYIGGGDFWNVKKNKRSYANPHHVVMSNREYGKIWRSLDRGSTWALKNNGLHTNADIGKLWVHPADPETVYAATSYGIFKSANRGDRWVNMGTALPHNMIRDMACHYDSVSLTTTIYVIDQVFWEPDGNGSIESTGGVFRTCDEGDTWENLNANLYLDFTSISSFVLDYYYGKLAFWFGISTDKSKTDYPQRPKAILQNFNRLLMDPSNTSRLYLGHSLRHDNSIYPGDLWMTENAGRSWTSVARIGRNWQGADHLFWTSRGNPVNRNMRFAHLSVKVEDEPYPRTGCRALSVSSAGDVTGVFEQQTLQSKDHGITWNQIDDIETEKGMQHWVGTGSSNLPGRQIMMDPRMPGAYFFLSGEHGIWKLQDDGDKVWPGAASVKQIEGQVNDPGAAHSIASMAIHPRDTLIMYALMFRQEHAGQVRRTLDGGQNWENITPFENPVKTPDGTIANTDWNRRAHQYSLIIDRENPDNLYFCLPSWVLVDVGNHRDYITTQFGVHRSTDGGFHWTRQNTGISHDPADDEDYAVNALCFDPDDPLTLYAAVMRSFHGSDNGGLYVSHDSADSWTRLNTPSEIVSVNHVHVDSLSGKIYIACGHKNSGANNGGVWVSGDRGGTWEKIFEMPLVFKVRTAPYDSSRIAVIAGPANSNGSINPGIYVSLDNGISWSKSNRNMGQPDRVKDVHFDMTDPDVMWSSQQGSGWYKGFMKKGLIARAENKVAREGDSISLSASPSMGNILTYRWKLPEDMEAGGLDQRDLTLLVPEVSKDSTLLLTLHVGDGVNSDSTRISVFVRDRKLMARLSFLDERTRKGVTAATVRINDQSYKPDPTGSVYLEDMAPGNLEIEINSNYYEAFASQSVQIDSDTSFQFFLQPKMYDVCYKFLNFNTGEVLPGTRVLLEWEEVFADPEGLGCFTLPYGPHRIEASLSGFQDAVYTEFLSSDSTVEIRMYPQTWNASFSVRRAGTIEPLADAIIVTSYFEIQTDREGAAAYEVFEGPLRFSVSLDKYGTVYDTVMIRNDTSIRIEMVQVLADLTFRIYHRLQLVPDVQLRVADNESLTDTRGEAYFMGLPTSEEISYSIYKDGFVPVDADLILHADTLVKLSLEEEVSGLEDHSAPLRVYPNPAENILWLSGLEPGTVICIYDSKGIIFKEEKIEQEPHLLHVDHLPGGVYFLRTSGFVRKLVILQS